MYTNGRQELIFINGFWVGDNTDKVIYSRYIYTVFFFVWSGLPHL